MTTIGGRIVTERGVVAGRVDFERAILDIVPDGKLVSGPWVLPGFIDLHVHGGGGGDVMQGEDSVLAMARFHARCGTTTLLPTTMTDERHRIEAAFRGVAAAMALPVEDAAQIAGVHLEGPFISPDALGAQPDFAIPPDPEFIRRLQGLAPIRVATIAPEIDEAGILLDVLGQFGTAVQIGHTTCSAAQAHASLDAGYRGFTHLFNAMSGMHHRRPGAVGCALAQARHAELILDGLHVDALAARAALRAIPDLYMITDATAAAGMPDGHYRLGAHEVEKHGGGVFLRDGTLAGSALTMDRALRNLVGLGLSVDQASRRCATIQADYLGLADRGRIAPGHRADLVVMDDSLGVEAVFIAGREIER